MHRLSLTEYGTPLVAEDVATPAPAGSEVLVRVSHCGVCHSDIHMQDGYFDLGHGRKLDVTGGRRLPFTLGHEIAGVVEAVGEEAAGVTPGERRAVYPWIGCGRCARCDGGAEHLCERPCHLGITVDGGYASHVVVPHPRYLLDVAGIAPELAGSLMCSGLTAYAAINKARAFVDTGPVMIVGLGGVGMMGLQVARALGLSPVLACDIDPAKREVAAAAGADGVFDPGAQNARKAVFKAAGPVDAAIDFVGAASSLTFAQSILGKAGAVVVAGLLGGRFELPVAMFALRQLTIMGSFVGSLEEARELVEMVRSGKIEAIPLATRPLEEANAALDELRAGKIIGRVVLTP